MTNYEKIMSKMTVEQLAENMAVYFDEDCGSCPLEANGSCGYHKPCENSLKYWLNREAEK